MYQEFVNREDFNKMSSDSKIGLLATVGQDGAPHISFLSSLQPLGKDELTIGQFCEGMSKENIKDNPKAGWLIFSPDMNWWRGRADYFKTETTGEEFEMYNNKPLFRYNSYFGIGKVHYFKLKDLDEKRKLNMASLIPAALITKTASLFMRKKGRLNAVGQSLFLEIAGLKFLSYIDKEGYPVIVPMIQASSAGGGKIVAAGFPYGDLLSSVPDGASVCVLAVNLQMKSVLIKGKYRKGAVSTVNIERVYNSMPPFPGYIEPFKPIEKVEEF